MADCNNCPEKRPDVPWEVFQATAARANLANRRWFITWIITFVLLLGTLVYLFWMRSQYELVETEYTQEIDTGVGDLDVGGNIINRGGIYYGEDYADYADETLPPEDRRE